MKKIIDYIKSARSDLVLFLIALVLLNMVAYRAFVRFDLTAPRSYSLSKASVQTVRTLEEPLSVKVFFTANLPAPYNSVDQYVRDLLVEYKGKANRQFSYEFFDMTKPENERIARNYKLNQIQIQEVKNNEVQFKQAWMGMALTYADRVEILDGLTSSDGLEYRITTTIADMVATTSTLSGLDGKVTLTLYQSRAMSDLGIQGFAEMEQAIRAAYLAVNKANMEKIDFAVIDPATVSAPDKTSETYATELVQKYGIQAISWDRGEKHGILGLVLEYGNKFRVLPVKLTRTFFGQNVITGLDTLETTIADSLKGLVSKSVEIGYITGHGEWSTDDEENGSGRFKNMLSDRYTLKPLHLHDDDLNANLASVIINGPKRAIPADELYKLDQYVMRGGNLIVFLDPVDEVLPQGEMAYYQQPSYNPIDTELDTLLQKYGITPEKNYVLDEQCYATQQQGYGSLDLPFAPLLQKTGLHQKNAISKNLGYVIFLQTSSITLDNAVAPDAKFTVLAKSSPKSWLMTQNFSANPMFIAKPEDRSTMKSENLAVLAEGAFTSAFDNKPESADETPQDFAVSEHLAKSIQSGKIFVAGSSKLTSGQLIDEKGEQPIAMFVRNAVDYMNGAEDLCEMRTKGLSLNTLKERAGTKVTAAKYGNIYGLVVIVAIVGLIVWQKRTARRRKIRLAYNPNDSREVTTEKAKENT